MCMRVVVVVVGGTFGMTWRSCALLESRAMTASCRYLRVSKTQTRAREHSMAFTHSKRMGWCESRSAHIHCERTQNSTRVK